ncbi:hypothetical protein [Pseudomonas sp. R5(2019)]|uniref:hypothetical protein n=1 Tax=Pseudomonas sp. R5(2019) TaxID=2697566 RepID=UPI0014134DA5|nr:hypothetical protein [Pseudomonas sp. R5(2019)]NBA97293.1 hypothetical protein [Pseudomonas sp. R5(2019)]
MTDAPTRENPEDLAKEPDAAGVTLPWADVLPEQFQMLRLAPLPIDRSSGARPLRFVQHGRAERHSKERSLLRQDIQLPGQRVRKEQNHLDVWVDHATRRVYLDPQTGLQIEPVNRGLGRFLLAQGILWAQRRWPQYRIDGAALPSKDGLNEDTRLRRDHVLNSLGLTVEYADAQHLKGSYGDAQVGELIAGWNSERLQVVEILDASSMLQQADHTLLEQEVKLREQEERINQYRREDGGLRFTITCLVAFAVFQAGLLIWIATHR